VNHFKLSPKDLLRLSELITEETGNRILEKNHSMIESRLRAYCYQKGIENVEDYWALFAQNEVREREVLRGLMTTHYTFFFREYVHFESLENWIEANIERLKNRQRTSNTPVKIWSAAASKGQEAYSLAMFLYDVLLERYGVEFEILGTDIDDQAIKYASNAVYPIREVNTIPRHYLAKHWRKGTGQIKDYAALKPELRKRVAFRSMNLLKLDRSALGGGFDIIFSRNVFIYFDEANVKNIATSLASHLLDGGLFVSGVSEPLRFEGWNFPSLSPSVYLKPMRHEDLSCFDSDMTLKPEDSVKDKVVLPRNPTVSLLSPRSQTYRLLCVDDSPSIQKLMKNIFSQDPDCIAFECASNGREAREMLNQKTFDIITLDIHMPEVTGIEFLKNLYNKKQDPPVIMVSSVNRSDKDLATQSLNLGAFDYVEKPAMNNIQKSKEELLTKVRLAIRSKTVDSLESIIELNSKTIVVPDASTCLRVIFVDADEGLKSLQYILEHIGTEFRSPPTLIVRSADLPEGALESCLLKWTKRTVKALRGSDGMLRPNSVYHTSLDLIEEVLGQSVAQNISFQILAKSYEKLPRLGRSSTQIQVLLAESFESHKGEIEFKMGCRVSDVTPGTSFQSLSLEFFANLRKAA